MINKTQEVGKSVTRGMLEEMYRSIESGKNKPSYIYFQGIKYRLGSKPFNKALDNWYKKNGKTQ